MRTKKKQTRAAELSPSQKNSRVVRVSLLVFKFVRKQGDLNDTFDSVLRRELGLTEAKVNR